MEIIAQRVFNTLYIYLDIAFLVFFCTLLIVRKKYLTLLFALFGGVLYMVVDYGIFHLALHTRSIEGGDLFAVLLWMSMSYGITNFAWLWLFFSKDKHLFEWIFLICLWWVACPMLASTFGGGMPVVKIQRTTGSYHGAMALILLVGYGFAIVYNLFRGKKSERFPLGWLLIAGISVQFAWEFSLLLGGVRSAEIDSWAQKLSTLLVNSLLETNLGAVPAFAIYISVTRRRREDGQRRQTVSFTERMAEVNAISLRKRPSQTSPSGEAYLSPQGDENSSPQGESGLPLQCELPETKG